MRLADQIGSAADLKASIRQTLRMLQAQAQDDAAPPVLDPEVVKAEAFAALVWGEDVAPPVLAPEVVKAEGEAALLWINKWLAAHVAKRAQVQVIEGEAAEVEVIPPDDSASVISALESRETYTKINNQNELIKTLKSSVGALAIQTR